MGPLLTDKDWVRQAFLVPASDLETVDQQNRAFSTASLKFTDTAPGGNFAINPPPQYTRYADLKPRNQTLFKGGQGMGRYYSEAIDDHSQLIYLRFGVPQFTSATTFFTSFYNYSAGKLARTGRSTGLFYWLGRAAGFVVPIMSWKIMAVHLIGVAGRFFLRKPSSKFYYLKPTMPLYWTAVQTLVNQIAVNMGIVPRIGGDETTNTQLGDSYQFTQADRELLHAKMPDIISEGGQIDVWAIANRAQRIARRQAEALKAAFNENDFDLTQKIQSIYQTRLDDKSKQSYESYMTQWLSSAAAKPAASGGGSSNTGSSSNNSSGVTLDPGAMTGNLAGLGGSSSDSSGTAPASTANVDGTMETASKSEADNTGWMEFLEAEWDDGAAFACFRVNATGPVSESFSNSVTESEIASKMNSVSAGSRTTNFNLSGGNLADVPVIGSVVNAVKDFAGGLLDSVQLSGLAALGGAAYVDIPQRWQSSTAKLPSSSYTINLVSPYGNKISQLLNLYLPLAMLLAGTLPLSTGKQSYTSPFICELYDKGRCQTRLGMIDSLSITRGTGNTGFNANGQAMGIEVTFTVVDMSTVMHMPISEGFSMTDALVGAVAGSALGVVGAAVGAGAATGIFDDETAFTDYMAILGSMGMADQIYGWRRFKLNLTRKMADFKSWTSPAHWASVEGDMLPSRIISAFYKGSARG